jgi:DnaJ like chaperone protein
MRRRRTYITLLFTTIGQLQILGGVLSKLQESDLKRYIKSNLRLSQAEIAIAITAFRQGRLSDQHYENTAMSFYQAFRRNPAILHGALKLLNDLVKLNGPPNSSETAHLQRIAAGFGIDDPYRQQSQAWFNTQKKDTRDSHSSEWQAMKPVLRAAYALFDMPPGTPLRKLKKRFRELAQECHPDRAISRGLPQDYVQSANEDFKKLVAAWEQIRADCYQRSA